MEGKQKYEKRMQWKGTGKERQEREGTAGKVHEKNMNGGKLKREGEKKGRECVAADGGKEKSEAGRERYWKGNDKGRTDERES